jgi:hypothetical protein
MKRKKGEREDCMTRTNGRRITTHEATITTASIEIRTLTLSGKQMTLAVFRQLLKAPLIDEASGHFLGMPWGTVNYHQDCHYHPRCRSCAYVDVHGPKDHLHVVWQTGQELRQAVVPHECPRCLLTDLMDELEAMAVTLYRLRTRQGFWPSWWKSPGHYRTGRLVHSVNAGERQITITINVPQDLQEVWDLRVKAESGGAGRENRDAILAAIDQAMLKVRQALADEAEADWRTIQKDIEARALGFAQLQQHWQKRYDELSQLDQLFIAV